jgi:DNA-binding protein HU-beta
MTKTELIDLIAAKAKITKVQAKTAYEAIVEASAKGLKKDGRFVLAGLGIFSVVKRAKRAARNPRTGEPLTIKAHKAVKFKAAKAVKDTVN